MNAISDKWHSAEKMDEMKTRREKMLKKMSRKEFTRKETDTFFKVREFFREKRNNGAYALSYKMPWFFYGVHSFDECIKILTETAG